MPRIEGSRTAVRLPAGEEQSPPPAAPQATSAARPTGHSGASTFETRDARAVGRGPGDSARGGGPKLTPNDLGVQAQDQGATNACGTTSLANVMTHFGMPRTHEQIDESIRAFNLFTAPDKLVEYARGNGMRSEIKTDASLDDLAKMVDQGVPPIVLMDPDADNNANLHYVTVTGYNRDSSGKITDVAIADSAGGRRYTMPADEFQAKWDNLKMGGVPTGLNNVMITAVPNDGRKLVGGDGVSRKASEIELPASTLTSNLKSSLARLGANAISDVTGAADKVVDGTKAAVDGAKKIWKYLFN